MSIDIRWMIQEAALSEHDPVVIWQKVLPQVPDEELRSVCEQVGVYFVRTLLSHKRQDIPKGSPGRPVPARKFLAYVERYPVTLASGWKALAECTRDEVLEAARVRYEHAASNKAAADRLSSLAEKMRACGADTVRDLPDEILAGVFSAEVPAPSVEDAK